MDEQRCLEMFMLARRGDQYAQEWFQYRFRDMLRAWLERHPGKEDACRLNSEEYYVERAFQCAWDSSFDRIQVEFKTLRVILLYLCANLNGQILDALRTLKKASIRSATPQEAIRREDRFDPQALWEQILVSLSNERERRLAYLLFHCNLKPVEIVRAYPQEFGNVAEITRVRLSVVKNAGSKIEVFIVHSES